MNGSLNQTSTAVSESQPWLIRWFILVLVGVGVGWAGIGLVSAEVARSQLAGSASDKERGGAAPGGLSRLTLKSGSKGDEVSELQSTLKLLGYYGGTVDGVYGESTVTAVSLFQKSAGLSADGIAGPATWNRLFPPTPTISATALPAPVVNRPPGAQPMNPGSPHSANAAIAGKPAAGTSSGAAPTTIAAKPGGATAAFPIPSALTPAPSQPAHQPAAVAIPAKKPNTAKTGSHPSPGPVATNSSLNAATPELITFPILRLGMKGPAVIGLQRRLRAIGLLKSSADGVFGSETQDAVKAAQRKFKLEADGVVGPATWIELMQ
ncbi:peptidoglycan-binding protein [Kovacikia minuta CCNUW1]|uniref:peptidoglycan-binding domain-containing protein n=1 Tax=Kovacikia minuta TaxID=2931930 RepID=UPI001CC95FC6|nr:peptidoglycan-binding domain-containing protein [Kovacikia minuta]UBF26915.1 peptidoglycan-binding protein [Kovacikia minuta CCNUW1]